MKMHSLLWTYYHPPSQGKAKCKYCSKEVAITGGNTSGQKKHLKVHPKSWEEFMSKQEEKDKMQVVTNRRPADEKVNEKPLKQMKLDFGANEATTAKQVEIIFPAY